MRNVHAWQMEMRYTNILGECKYMINKDNSYKELTIVKNTYMTNGDEMFHNN